MPAAASVMSGAAHERKCRPTISAMSRIEPRVISGSAPTIASYCASCAGAGPVCPARAPSAGPQEAVDVRG